MEKMNILQENLCIKKIISVIRGQNSHHHKLLAVKGRHSDAFVYVIEGSCTYHFDDKIEFEATAGDVFYLPHQAVYTMYIHTENYKFVFCDFEFAESAARCGVLCAHQDLKNIDSMFFKLLTRFRSSSGNAYTACMSILYSIYSMLQQNAEQVYLSKSKKEDMTQAKRYIDENFRHPALSIAKIAEENGFSEVYFRKLFKARYGIPPSKYLLSVRLKNAKELMKYPFLGLEECALQSGFSSLPYFCRLFKKENGISPGKYKKEL